MRRTALSLGALLLVVLTHACSSTGDDSADGETVVPHSAGGTTGAGGAHSGGKAGGGGSSGGGGSKAGAGGTGFVGAGGTAGSCDPACTGKCIGGVCCDLSQACAAVCCADSDVCSFQKCVTPGKSCADASDCDADQYCERGLGDASAGMGGAGGAVGAGGSAMCGAAATKGKCLPKPPTCPAGSAGAGGASGAGGADPNAPITCVESCEYHPPTAAFDPMVAYSWGGDVTKPYSTDVMMTPIVVELDDDDCDGKITGRDIPEIIFSTFSGGCDGDLGELHVISIVDGKIVEKLSLPGAVAATGGLAAGDLDGDGAPEIVGCLPATTLMCSEADGAKTGVVAFDAKGKKLWEQADTTQVICGYNYPAIADPEGTGHPLVLVGMTLLDGATGAVVKVLAPPGNGFLSGFSDVDGDGTLDVLDGIHAFHVDGTPIWDLSAGADAIKSGYFAIGDLDKDGVPEIVVIASSGPHLAYVFHYDDTSASHVKLIRSGIDINAGMSTMTYCMAATEYGGGPPTIADFDGDGFPDVGVAGAVGYIVLSGKKLMTPAVTDTTLWFRQTHDCSSAVTGSSVFDFNGDGRAEVVYSDEFHLWMYDGSTGKDLIPSTCNTTGTLYEYPVIADVDGDGQADIVVASNAYAYACPDDGTRQSGVRILSSASHSWVRTRPVWNEHTYHVTNVDDAGGIPKKEVSNWTVPGLDDFRQNKAPGGEFAAPDAVVYLLAPICGGGPYGLVATVRNIGEAALPAGVIVGFYEGAIGSGTKLGTAKTTTVLYPAQSEAVKLLLPMPDPAIMNGTKPVYAVVDDGSPPHPSWHECKTDNDTSGLVSGKCNGMK